MLHAVMIAEGGEPVAPVRPSKSDLDRRDIQRKLIRHWPTVYHLLVDRTGRPTGCEHLNPNWRPNPDGFKRPGPRLVDFWGPDPREDTLGAWCNRGGDGVRGDNLFELVMYLAQVDMKVATTFLRDLSERLVELPR